MSGYDHDPKSSPDCRKLAEQCCQLQSRVDQLTDERRFIAKILLAILDRLSVQPWAGSFAPVASRKDLAELIEMWLKREKEVYEK